MSKNKLSNIENNLAVIVGLTQAQRDIMVALADQYDKLTEVSEDFREAAEVWKQSAIETKKSLDIQMAALDSLDINSNIKTFLESHQLQAKWIKK